MEISVIIAAHNCEKYIGRAVRSALSQSFPKNYYEIMVVDDGSTDDTKKILATLKDKIKIISFKKNRGLPYARNYAIKNAMGRYVVCLDADDYISNSLLTIENLFLRANEGMDAVSCDYMIVDDKETFIERRNAAEHPIACGIMFKKDNLTDIGLYDEKFRVLEDLDLRKRYLEKYNIYNLPLPLYRYRHHENNLTKKKKRMDHYSKKLIEKHKIDDLHSYVRNHKNIRAGVQKCLT